MSCRNVEHNGATWRSFICTSRDVASDMSRDIVKAHNHQLRHRQRHDCTSPAMSPTPEMSISRHSGQRHHMSPATWRDVVMHSSRHGAMWSFWTVNVVRDVANPYLDAIAIWRNMARHGATWHDMARHGATWRDMARHVARHGATWRDVARHGATWV